MTLYHPWRDLRRREHLVLKWEHLPRPLLAVTDGARVWMDPRQGQARRRSTLAHELVHLDRGDTACQPARVEREVEEEAARRLIPLRRLVDALLWSQDEGELAEELWVDRSIVRARLDGLTEGERDEVEAAMDHREEAL